MIRNKLDLFQIKEETYRDESLISYFYQKVMDEFYRVEKQLAEEYSEGINITKDLKYRNELMHILSTEYTRDLDYYDFFERYGEVEQCI